MAASDISLGSVGMMRPSAALMAASENKVRPGGQSIRMKSKCGSNERYSSAIRADALA
jgi:hypothetical protein